jgi:hypothetical protein
MKRSIRSQFVLMTALASCLMAAPVMAHQTKDHVEKSDKQECSCKDKKNHDKLCKDKKNCEKKDQGKMCKDKKLCKRKDQDKKNESSEKSEATAPNFKR